MHKFNHKPTGLALGKERHVKCIKTQTPN